MPQRIAIIGVGLVGGSLGMALRAAGDHVTGYDLDAQTLERARVLQALDEVAPDMLVAVEQADLVVVATPVGQVAKTVAEMSEHLRPGTVVTDVGSTKASIVAEAQAAVGPDVSFVGGHPMAGTEGEGVDSARSDLFEQALWILTPTTSTHPDAFRRVNAMVASVGARSLALEPQVHDRLVALVSHLPYALGTVLAALAGREGDERVFSAAAGSFRDATRTAGSNPGIWRDILAANRVALLDELDSFTDDLKAFREALEGRDWDRLDELMHEARSARERFPLKGERGPAAPVTLDVPVADRQGVLSDITTAVGDAGINIEDLWLEHGPAGGAVRIVVDGEETAARAIEAVSGRGYRARVVRP